MNVSTGEIDTVNKQLPLTENHVEISKEDMTDEQKRTNQVELDDDTSKLGKLRHDLVKTRQARRLYDRQNRKNPIVKEKRFKYVYTSKSKYTPHVGKKEQLKKGGK